MLEAMECPQCALVFTPKRSNQRFCSRRCQQASSRHSARGSRSEENEARSARHFERSQRLFEMLYSAPPLERLGVMQEILSYVPTDTGLRNILTDPVLLSERPRVDGRKNVSQAANAYTKKFYGISISTYVRKVRLGEGCNPIEVSPAVDTGDAIPMLRPSLTTQNVRCWHRPLAAGPEVHIKTLRDAAQAARELHPEVADSLDLMADVKQAHMVTPADYERAARLLEAEATETSEAA